MGIKMTLREVAERLEKAFPECNIGGIGMVAVVDKDSPIYQKLAWRILMSEKEEDKSE